MAGILPFDIRGCPRERRHILLQKVDDRALHLVREQRANSDYFALVGLVNRDLQDLVLLRVDLLQYRVHARSRLLHFHGSNQ